MSSTPTLNPRTAPDPSTAPERCSGAARLVVRRRDGIALAATGAIPDRVRHQILAEHRAARDAHARLQIRGRIDAGLYPLPIPYGYRRSEANPTAAEPTHPTDTDVVAADPTSVDTDRATTWTGHHGRRGRAPAVQWRIDPDAAATVRLMTWWVRNGVAPTEIAARLNAWPDQAPLRTLTGNPRRWSAAAVRTLLTDPVLTGHGVWGRTHHGRPQPRDGWVVSAAPTHPPILDPTTHTRMVEILTGETATAARPTLACPARPRWRR